ncbi:MAG: hypothetical protein IKU15_01040 [Clostridia bacterium]|nr:hypothetical protein [Clostridia bacterium]
MQAFIYRHDINAEDTVWVPNLYFLNEWVKLHCTQVTKEDKYEEYCITHVQFLILVKSVESISNSVLKAFSKVFNTAFADECEINDLRSHLEEQLNTEAGFDVLDNIDDDFYIKLQSLLKSLAYLEKQNYDNINYTYYVIY